MSVTRQRIFAVCAAWIIATCCEAQTNAPRAAYTPQPVAEPSWQRRIGEQQQQLANQPCRVCFVGDSLTESWEYSGRGTWELEFAPLKALNLGITGDRTEHILNRIQRLSFHRANPKVVVLMMGTNNLAMDPPDKPVDVARAINDGVSLLHQKLPKASILLLTIPPSGDDPASPLRQRIKDTNALLASATWPAHVRLLPIHDAMLDEQRRWRPGLSADGTHFTEVGYSKLGELIAPVVRELLKGK